MLARAAPVSSLWRMRKSTGGWVGLSASHSRWSMCAAGGSSVSSRHTSWSSASIAPNASMTTPSGPFFTEPVSSSSWASW